ncbi:beta-carotene 15,15'-monooxygenase [Lysinibacillus sp. 54212]|uniref:beta-carotene 15,15'-monooxygenase n=1 Tax=Lysinibacillus sp. 54212 TaxID=3119829 RepID=UPI002FCB77C9
MLVLKRKKNLWFVFGLLILLSNMMLYRTSFGHSILPQEANGVVLGSLIDLAIIAPLAFLLSQKKFSVKKFILLAAAGCVAARFIIPIEHLEPFVMFTWVGFAIEGVIILFELAFVSLIFIYLPKMISYVKQADLPVLFAFPKAVDKFIPPQKIVRILCTEMMMFYYAFATWRKSPPSGVTLHKNTSYFAMQLMIIHAILIETIGIHWWLHDVSPILSIILLILNIYSVLFFIGDMQAMRLTPILFKDEAVFITEGLMKSAEISYDKIEEIITDKEILEQKLTTKTLQFIVRDFEPLQPQIILRMKEPITAVYYLGLKKQFKEVAIRVDDPQRFLQQLQVKM